MTITLIGGGAAGCLCSIELRRSLPDARVIVLESSDRTLAKVAITGGGRCNLTNSFEGVTDLSQVYPRGSKLMHRVLKSFDQRAACEWFESEGVRLTLQEDHCVFPESQDAMQIVRTLQRLMQQTGVDVRTSSRVESIRREGARYEISIKGDDEILQSDIVVVTTGGMSRGGSNILSELGIEMVPTVPSLFSFNIEDEGLCSLMGAVAQDVLVSIPGTKFVGSGPLLVTHWGISGPAVIKLSSYAARYLAERQYRTPVAIRWAGGMTEQDLRIALSKLSHSQRMVAAYPLYEGLPARLWEYIVVSRAALRPDIRYSELGSKGLGRLVATLLSDSYMMSGKNRFKQEFVTAGGVALSGVNPSTLESRQCPGLYFAGEVLDIDGITGGFNLQAAWSTGYVVASSIIQRFAILPITY